MAPTRNGTNGAISGTGSNGNGKTRKPLVEKRRRARINESLQELRALIADADLQSKMENAEVLELTVNRVENILQNRSQEVDAVNREACERFAAGYIQCMHDVHTFVSSCPGVEPTMAAELLNHLLESMPLSDQERLRVTLPEATECPISKSTCSESTSVSPSTSTSSSEDSDLDDTEAEQSQVSSAEEPENHEVLSSASLPHSMSVWRPW